MKTISKLASGLALAAISSSAMAAGTGIAQTRHNLGAGNMIGGNHTNATTEICIFCHTPHGGNQGAAAPLWNRNFSSTTVYTRYSSLGTTTFDADEVPIGSVSIGCLSCHDGTQAMDAVINSPGSGSGNAGWTVSSMGFDSNGNATGGAAGSYTSATGDTSGWTETNIMSHLKASDFGTIGDMIYLGTDLRNDHPVSMQYGGGGISDTNSGAAPTMGDGDYAVASGNSTATGAWGSNNAIGGTGVVNTRVLANGTSRVWWVDTGGTGQSKTDMPLYSRNETNQNVNGTGAVVTGNQPYVECATCHDPHTNNRTFLRNSNGNEGSAVCLTCHAK